MKKELWNFHPYFTVKEFACKCGECKEESGLNMRISFMHNLTAMRVKAGFPFNINSGWRCLLNREEINKEEGGTHYLGYGGDIGVKTIEQRDWLIDNAHKFGFYGVGKGRLMVHLDNIGNDFRVPRPASWTYN